MNLFHTVYSYSLVVVYSYTIALDVHLLTLECIDAVINPLCHCRHNA